MPSRSIDSHVVVVLSAFVDRMAADSGGHAGA